MVLDDVPHLPIKLLPVGCCSPAAAPAIIIITNDYRHHKQEARPHCAVRHCEIFRGDLDMSNSTSAPDRSPWLSKIMHALIAVDGSPTSLRAASVGGSLLGCFPEARLSLVYVAPLPRELQFSGSGAKVVVEFPLSSVIRETAGPALEAALTALGAAAGRAEMEVQVGEPAREICDSAEAMGVDLIVIGALGTSGESTGLGSVTQKVLSRARCPVLVVS